MKSQQTVCFNPYVPSQVLVPLLLPLLLFTLSMRGYSQTATSTPEQPQAQSPQPRSSNDNEHSESLAEKTANVLKAFFIVVLYPTIVIGVFLLLIVSIFYVTSNGTGFGYVRRSTGAVLPVLFLAFILLKADKDEDPIKNFFLNRNQFVYLFSGMLVGIMLVEFGKRLIRTDDDRWGAIYNLFLSFMVVFLLYSFIKGFLDSLIYFLFSMIMAGGLDIIFGRPMEFASAGTSSPEGKRSVEAHDRPSRGRDSTSRRQSSNVNLTDVLEIRSRAPLEKNVPSTREESPSTREESPSPREESPRSGSGGNREPRW